MLNEIQESVHFIKSQSDFDPEFGIILGTGLGGLAKEIEVKTIVEYDNIPHFPASTVETHHGRMHLGTLEGRRVVAMQGRFHYYEGYSMQQVSFPVRVMKMLGISKLFISNAAGGLNPDYEISDLMVINDHINLLPDNPLTGKNEDELGVRFPDMSDPYDKDMIAMAMEIATSKGIPCHQGVYVSVQGPNLETKAEYKYLRLIGADAVGMSTVPENIVARHMGLPCFAISVITDLGVPGRFHMVSIEEVIQAASVAEPGLTQIIKELISSQ